MKEQSITKGFAVLSLAGIIVKILSFLYIPFLLAIIKEEGNGVYAAAYQVYVFIYVLTNAGLPVAISKAVSEFIAVGNYKDAVRSFKIARFLLIVIGTVMALFMFFSASFLAKIIHFEKSTLAILALSPTVLLTAIASAYRGYFQGRGNMTPTAVSQVIEQVINTVFTLVFAALFIGYGLEEGCAGGTVGTSMGALVAVIFLVMFYRKHHKFKVPEEYMVTQVKRHSYNELLKKILGYSIPITLTVGLQYAGNLVDLWNTKSRLLASGFTDEAASQMYSYLYKYQQLMNLPISVIVALAVAILPAISGAAAQKNRPLIQSKINYAFRLCFLIAVPSAVGFSVLSREVFAVLKYGEGSYLMLYGSIVLVFMAAVQIQASVMQGLNKLYAVTFNLLLGIVGKIVVNYFLISIPQLNILGAVIGSIVGFSIPLVLNMLVIRNILKVEVNPLQFALKPFIASGIMAVFVVISTYIFTLMGFLGQMYLVSTFFTIISVGIGMLVYLASLILIGGITGEDLDALPSKVKRLIPKPFMRRIAK
ncbi:MAG: polysaccharide biosynthesis protein [Clostridia bacterium]|nr:polysaccharide biosynthesis protein [Clostridia bacterium]